MALQQFPHLLRLRDAGLAILTLRFEECYYKFDEKC